MNNRIYIYLKYLFYTSILCPIIAGCNGSGLTSTNNSATNTASVTNSDQTVTNKQKLSLSNTQYLYINDAGFSSNRLGESVIPKIYVYKIDKQSGDLTYIDATLNNASTEYLKVSPNNKYLYLPGTDNTIIMYKINPINGKLIYIGTVPTGTNPQQISITPNNKFAYVSNAEDVSSTSSLSMYSIDESGILHSLTSESTVKLPLTNPITDAGAFSMSIDPEGKFLHIASYTTCCMADDPANVTDITTYKIESDGKLTYQSATIGGQSIYTINTSPNGEFVYTTSYYGTVAI